MKESKFWKAHTHPISVTKKHLEFFKDFLQVNDQLATLPSRYNRELKQQQRRRLRKRHLKSEFALPQTLSRLFHLVYFVKCWQMFLELNSKGLYQSSGKEKESCCLVFPSSTKREIRHFHVVVVQRRLRNEQKKALCMCRVFFANINLFLFWCSRCHRFRRRP